MIDNISYRIEMSKEEYEELVDILKRSRRKDIDSIRDKVSQVKKIDKTNTRKGIKVAIESKVSTSRAKVSKAIDELTREGKTATIYSVSVRAGISYNTSKKYFSL